MKKLLFLITTFVLCLSTAYVKAVEALPSGYVSLYSLNYQVPAGNTYVQPNMTATAVAAASSAQMVGPSNGWGDGDKYYNIARYDTLAIKLTFDTADAGKQVAVRIKWNLDGVGATVITYPAKDSPLLTSPTDSTRSYVYKMLMTKNTMGGMVFYNGASHWSFSYPGTTAKKKATVDYVAVRVVPITGVNLIDSVAKIEIGKTKNLAYALIPARATNDTLLWKSSNSNIATVSNGVVTAVANGSAWIKMTSIVDSTFTDSTLVTVTPYPTKYESLYALAYKVPAGNTYTQPNMTGTTLNGATSAQMVGPSNGWGDGDKYYDISTYDSLAIKLTFDSADAGKQVAVRIKWDLEGVSPVIITYPKDSSKLTFPTDSTRSFVYKMAMTKKTMGGMVFYNGASHWSFSYPGVAATKKATVDYVAIEKVTATGVKVAAMDTALAAALPIGKTTTMKPVFTPVVKNNMVTWTSTDSTIVKVNASGLLTALKAGTVTIRATSVTFPTLTATYTVNAIFIPVTSLTIADSATAVEIGKSKALAYTLAPLAPTNDTLVWSTSDTTIATVDKGVVTAIKKGTALIKVVSVSDTTKMDSCYVTVVPYPTKYSSLYSLTYKVPAGNTYTQPDMTGTVVAGAASAQMVGPSNGWGDGDKTYDISTYDSLAIKLTFDSADAGKQVAVRIKWDLEGVSPVIITYPKDSSKLAFPTDSTRSFVYKMAMTKKTMGGMVFYNGASHWSFSYPGVAATKKATIDYIAIEKVMATGVKVAAMDTVLAAALPIGATTTMKAVFTPVVKNNKVTWESTDSTIAKVNASGVVTALKVGAVSIKATSVTFPTLSATYAVNAIFVPVTSLTIADSAVNVEIGKTKTLDYALLPLNATNDTVVWSTSDTTIATVVNGVVTAIKKGTALIKVTSVSDTTMMDSCYVTVTPYPTKYINLYSFTYNVPAGNTYVQSDMNGTAVAPAASTQMVGPASGWGDGDKYFDISTYDSLMVKITFDSADAGKQVALRMKWDLEAVSPIFITYPTDSSKLTFPTDSTRSFVYKMAMTKKTMGGMVFYNGASHWSFSYPGVAATKKATIDYIAIEKVMATGVKVAAMDTALAAALPGTQSTTLIAVFAPVVKNNLVTWSSSDTDIATVDANGVVTAGTTTGTATITATSVTFPTLSATYDVVVTPVVAVKTIQQDNQNALVNVYSITGTMVRRSVKASEATLGLEKGLYIVGNKKVLVTK